MTKKNVAKIAAETSSLEHAQIALEAFGCALNGMHRTSQSWYETAAHKARNEGDEQTAVQYEADARQQGLVADRKEVK